MKLTNVRSYVIRTDPPNAGGLFWFSVKLETYTMQNTLGAWSKSQ